MNVSYTTPHTLHTARCAWHTAQRVCQVEHMTLLYLHHIPHTLWCDFGEAFILNGGLNALAHVLSSDNLYIRGQAMDALLQVGTSVRVQ